MKRVIFHSCKGYKDLKNLLNSDINLAMEFFESRYCDALLENLNPLIKNFNSYRINEKERIVFCFYPHLIDDVVYDGKYYELIMKGGLSNFKTSVHCLRHVFSERFDLFEKAIKFNLKTFTDIEYILNISHDYFIEMMKDRKKIALKYNLSESELDDIQELLDNKSTAEKKIPDKEFTIEEIKKIAKSFLEEYSGGIIAGSAALAFLTKKFVPDVIEVFCSDEEQYQKIVNNTDSRLNPYTDQVCVNYQDFRIDVTLLSENYTLMDIVDIFFRVDCCKVVWDPSLENPFSKTDIATLMCIKYNKFLCDSDVYVPYYDIKLYRERGFNIYPI